MKSQRCQKEAVVYRGSGRKIDERGARPVYRVAGIPRDRYAGSGISGFQLFA